MHGTINVAAIMAEHQARASLAPPTTPRDAEHRQDWLDRQRIGSMQMAYAQYGACQRDEKCQAEVKRLWGGILTEALERRRKYDRWAKRVYMKRVVAWQARMKKKALMMSAGEEIV